MPRKKKVRIGRPPVAARVKRSASITVRFRESELKMLRKVSGKVPVTVWIREAALAAAKK